MKTLTIWQPWASLIARGGKRWETRSLGTSYRGLLAIHAAKRWRSEQRNLCTQSPFMDGLGLNRTEALRIAVGKEDLPLGVIVAVGKLVDCRPTESLEVLDEEAAFGDFRPGRNAWLIEDVQRLDEPVSCRGHQGIWDVPREIMSQLIEGVPA